MTQSIGWTETLPSDASLVGVSPPEIRSVWSAIAAGLGQNGGPLYFPGTGGGSEASAGDLQPGNLRANYGVHSLSSNDNSADTIGRIYVASDRSRAYVTESDGTYLLGSRYLIEHTPTKAATNAWITQRGFTPMGSTQTTITFATPFMSAPTVFVSTSQNTSTLEVTSITVTDFKSTASGIGIATPDGTLWWWAMGAISVASL